MRKLVTGGLGDKDIITLAAAKQKAVSGSAHNLISSHPICSNFLRKLIVGGE